tara:strand:- start:370 stop:558 length:189 start_codon:yes stop_codon:yes gene_type:complete
MKGIKTMHKTNDKDHQLNLIEKITDKAIKQVQKETKNQNRNYILEWFRYVEIVSEKLSKHLN